MQTQCRGLYAQFPIFDQDAETVMRVVEALGWELAKTHRSMFEDLVKGAKAFLAPTPAELRERTDWLSDYLQNPSIKQYGLKPDLFAIAHFVQALVTAGKSGDLDSLVQLIEWSGQEQLRVSKQVAGWLEARTSNLRVAAKRLW